jgi:methyl-accepting chemotaxis protein
MRAADAVETTADLIEGTVKKVKDGFGLLGTTDQAFKEF